MDDAKYCPACGTALDTGGRDPVCPSCGRVHHRDPKVGVGAVVRDDAGRLLLVCRGVAPGIGLWALPAGFVDAGEDPRDAAARETLEETGLEVAVTDVIDVYTSTGGSASFFLAFHGSVVGGALAPGDDATDARFFAAHELPELAFESTRAAAGWNAPAS